MFVLGKVLDDDFSACRVHRDDIDQDDVLVGDVFWKYFLVSRYRETGQGVSVSMNPTWTMHDFNEWGIPGQD